MLIVYIVYMYMIVLGRTCSTVLLALASRSSASLARPASCDADVVQMRLQPAQHPTHRQPAHHTHYKGEHYEGEHYRNQQGKRRKGRREKTDKRNTLHEKPAPKRRRKAQKSTSPTWISCRVSSTSRSFTSTCRSTSSPLILDHSSTTLFPRPCMCRHRTVACTPRASTKSCTNESLSVECSSSSRMSRPVVGVL